MLFAWLVHKEDERLETRHSQALVTTVVIAMIMARKVISAQKGKLIKINLISLAHKGSLDRSQPWSPIKEIFVKRSSQVDDNAITHLIFRYDMN